MKAGIVSLFGTFNYGNRLQNYAVQEVLRKLSFETEVIYIQNKRTYCRELAKKIYFSPMVRIITRPDIITYQKYKKQIAFNAFNSKYIYLKRYFSLNKIKDADYYVLGSDQVWNPGWYDDIYKQLFFLTFTIPEKKVCFSPSFGLNDIPENWKPYFLKNLLTFPNISVRETAGANIIKNLINKDADILIDPTLMLDSEDWRLIENKPNGLDTTANYIFNYFLGGVPIQAQKTGKSLSKQLTANIYNILDPAVGDLYFSGPSEFLYLIDHASIIQTDSFHACIFAFLFGKPFLLYDREGSQTDIFSRMETLFNTFDLRRKYVNSGLDNDILECDYSIGYNKLKEERRKVIQFLKKSMNLKE